MMNVLNAAFTYTGWAIQYIRSIMREKRPIIAVQQPELFYLVMLITSFVNRRLSPNTYNAEL
jgi:hypothetical protein